MNKSARITSFVETLSSSGDAEISSVYDPCYLGYFECFNAQRYYEAHDVLEHLWLRDGKAAPDYSFYKGLIQLAGGFVHLKLHYFSPEHPKHGRRLAPAKRLFLRAAEHLIPYGERHRGLDLIAPLTLARSFVNLLDNGDSPLNPWSPNRAPRLPMPREKAKD